MQSPSRDEEGKPARDMVILAGLWWPTWAITDIAMMEKWGFKTDQAVTNFLRREWKDFGDLSVKDLKDCKEQMKADSRQEWLTVKNMRAPDGYDVLRLIQIRQDIAIYEGRYVTGFVLQFLPESSSSKLASNELQC